MAVEELKYLFLPRLDGWRKKENNTGWFVAGFFGGGQLVWEALGNFQLGPKSSIANSGPICLISFVLGRVWFCSAPNVHPQEELS